MFFENSPRDVPQTYPGPIIPASAEGKSIVTADAVIGALATIWVGFRLYSRRMKRMSLQVEDYFLLAASVCFHQPVLTLQHLSITNRNWLQLILYALIIVSCLSETRIIYTRTRIELTNPPQWSFKEDSDTT